MGEVPGAPSSSRLPSPEGLLSLYRDLLRPRVIEERMLLLVRQGKLSKWFSGIGQEAIAVGVTSALQIDDWVLPMHRNLGVFTTRGVDLLSLFRQLLGREGGFTKGRDRTFHFGYLEKRIVGMISHLGAMLPVADGLALAAQLGGTGRVVAAFTGDGATSEGDFHEAVNLAAVWRLPVLFVIENNQYGLSTPASEQYACRDLADRGVGYGIPGVAADGNDVLTVFQAASSAADRARRGLGPTILEFKTFRMRGHEEASGTDYVPPALAAEWTGKDPIRRLEGRLLQMQAATRAECEALRGELEAETLALVEQALSTPPPASTPEAEVADVFAPGGLTGPEEPAAETAALAPERRYVDAIHDALALALRENPRVILMGQDVAEYGGVFKVTEGLAAEFGKQRVRNTPIVESAALGAALGLALDGYVPIVEMQFADFITCGFNQIVNNLAKTRYRWGAPVGVVVRAPVGGGVGAGPFHSQNVESWFTGVAGLKIVAPSTPLDAKGLLLAAIRDGNPVLFLEHKGLYRSIRGRVPEGDYGIPIGKARVARQGSHATVVTYGAGVRWALEAAEALHEEGAEVEVVDLRSLAPWDVETVVGSVRRTSRALVLHEAPITGGFGAEVAAVLGREAFECLDAPVARLGALDTPVPFSPALEAQFEPRQRVLPALRELLAY
jgi:2-oxoisovalerate dehydrogenase E1 component